MFLIYHISQISRAQNINDHFYVLRIIISSVTSLLETISIIQFIRQRREFHAAQLIHNSLILLANWKHVQMSDRRFAFIEFFFNCILNFSIHSTHEKFVESRTLNNNNHRPRYVSYIYIISCVIGRINTKYLHVWFFPIWACKILFFQWNYWLLCVWELWLNIHDQGKNWLSVALKI